MAVMIGVDPHKGSHTAYAIDEREQRLAELRVRSGPKQLQRLLEWAAPLPERTWAIENATGLGYLLAQQLVAAASASSTCSPSSQLASVCWTPRRRTRTTAMTPPFIVERRGPRSACLIADLVLRSRLFRARPRQDPGRLAPRSEAKLTPADGS